MRRPTRYGPTAFIMVALTLSGCGKIKQNKPEETAQTRAEARRYKDACASSSAYDRLKRVLFNEARSDRSSHRTNLDTLESFSFIRMEDPVVIGRDPALDITRCKGRLVLDVPPGSERALGGERRLIAEITYTAQAAADGSGLVYVLTGAEPIVSKLAAFDLPDATYRPLPALDAEPSATLLASAEDDPLAAPPDIPATQPHDATLPTPRSNRDGTRGGTLDHADTEHAGEQTVRTFYEALGAGDGALASAQIIPAKRSSRTYSADAISRFYGRLSDPLQLTGIRQLEDDTYRVTYRYAGTGIRCNGRATVRTTRVGDRALIRSITAGDGC
ncbi:hypothetical protein [Sphingomonas jatrophae]|uniref:Uncharacterized protein n=1 Tax=Sphingomonas jatrophae TaxID=1166337 RepID=A0A1I6L0L7_9SPHN|nr:hypothetical protein [Sphingomonas jatrophae]SFR96808.1 hypothetical protein SAMN05192580_2078 [Sphingomonas jatrophae]